MTPYLEMGLKEVVGPEAVTHDLTSRVFFSELT